MFYVDHDSHFNKLLFSQFEFFYFSNCSFFSKPHWVPFTLLIKHFFFLLNTYIYITEELVKRKEGMWLSAEAEKEIVSLGKQLQSRNPENHM